MLPPRPPPRRCRRLEGAAPTVSRHVRSAGAGPGSGPADRDVPGCACERSEVLGGEEVPAPTHPFPRVRDAPADLGWRFTAWIGSLSAGSWDAPKTPGGAATTL